ncbi:MAG: FliM/FliN family flagellar motor switch protein [Candidatus Gastranaerophilales bacterium]|nr:FliM/FliN family flagellar motor switch protein [Candidatus Gastranaerophilales bacterium]
MLLYSKKENSLINAGFSDCPNLKRSFYWFSNEFSKTLENSSDEFLGKDFKISLIGLNNVTDIFWKNTDFFVTQIKMTPYVPCFIRNSQESVKIFLDNSLGIRKQFSLAAITDLEAQILTSFNHFFFKKLKSHLISEKKIQKNFNSDTPIDLIHFIFNVSFNNEDSGIIIISLPSKIIKVPEILPFPEKPLNLNQFNELKTDVDIYAGSSRIFLKELKNLEEDDIVILDNSNIHAMRIKGRYEMDINVNPDPNMVININEEEDNQVNETNTPIQNQDIWDNIQVDIKAEFEKIKMPLGELRQISEGLIVDIAPIIRNQVALKVENKAVARGELVIIGDRFAVKLTEVIQEADEDEIEENMELEDEEENTDSSSETDGENEDLDDDDFDYSDFEIEDDV